MRIYSNFDSIVDLKINCHNNRKKNVLNYVQEFHYCSLVLDVVCDISVLLLIL